MKFHGLINEKGMKIASQFTIPGEYTGAESFGSGHINDTYLVTFRQATTNTRYVLQRINNQVFTEPSELMDNMLRVCRHQMQKLREQNIPDSDRRCLQVVPSRDGRAFIVDEEGKCCRVCPFIENTYSTDVIKTPQNAYEVGKAFAQFQLLLSDFAGPRLHETIVDFHNTEKRFTTFIRVVDADVCNRAQYCKKEIDFILNRASIAPVLVKLMRQGVLAERITHNDTKINNVLFDCRTHNALCVVDLDTVMPGTVLYDFGDMVRSSTCPVAEDEMDLEKVGIQLPLFKGLTEGYIRHARGFLSASERRHLVLSGIVITFEQMIRFLTDYLMGDIYYKTRDAGQNLDRCRNQGRLVQSIEENEEELNRIVENIFNLVQG